jgi:hypothetical protein
MEYKLFNRYDDPGTSNETDNFVWSWSLFQKYLITRDFRPSPGPNISWIYSIVYSLEDVAWNKRTKTRNVIIHWMDRSINYVPMDICNETNWDHSWDYYDWECEWEFNVFELRYKKKKNIIIYYLKKGFLFQILKNIMQKKKIF